MKLKLQLSQDLDKILNAISLFTHNNYGLDGSASAAGGGNVLIMEEIFEFRIIN